MVEVLTISHTGPVCNNTGQQGVFRITGGAVQQVVLQVAPQHKQASLYDICISKQLRQPEPNEPKKAEASSLQWGSLPVLTSLATDVFIYR